MSETITPGTPGTAVQAKNLKGMCRRCDRKAKVRLTLKAAAIYLLAPMFMISTVSYHWEALLAYREGELSMETLTMWGYVFMTWTFTALGAYRLAENDLDLLARDAGQHTACTSCKKALLPAG
jgi:hypothetical protein